jgi:hypothetical protein
MDIKPAIYEMNMVDGKLILFSDSSSAGNVKPNLLLEKVCKECQVEYNPLAFAIRRIDMFTRNIDGILISMDEVGEDF